MTFLIAIASVLFYFSTETEDIEKQEHISELIAEEYLVKISQNIENGESNQEEIVPSTEETISDLDYEDNDVFSYFDESYAWGYVDCVLEIPAIDLRQSIFTGTPAQIEHDLSNWLSVTARADYVLGDTHYCIYMHNPKNKSIKISYAQYDLREKDYMVITKGPVVYLYEVTGVFPEWRDKCTDIYVNNMAVDRDKLYIFTCGRDEWQGRNVVVEGTVRAVYQTSDWNENKEEYIEKYKKAVGLIQEEVVEEKERLIMKIESDDKLLKISLYGPNYTKVENCSIGICDVDGYLIDMIENPMQYVGDVITIGQLGEGEYYIGVYENKTDYLDPIPYKIVIDKKTYTQSIVSVDEEAVQKQEQAEIMKIVAIVMLATSFMLGVFAVVKSLRQKQK